MDDNCTEFDSESQDFLKALNATETALLVICGVLCVVDIVIFIDNVLFLRRKHSVNQIKTAVATATWLVGLCPTLASICWISMVVPNAFLFRDVLVTGCMSVVMYKFVQLGTLLARHYTGLRERMRETQRMRFDVAPLACCCKCLPTASITKRRVLVVKGLVLQFPVVSMPIAVLTMYLWVDGKYKQGKYTADNPWPYLTATRTASTLTAMYGLGILYAMVREPLKMTYISQKYLGLKLCTIVFNVQHLVFRILSSNDVFDPKDCFSGRVMGDFYENAAFSFELFAISLLNLWAYRRPFGEEPSVDLAESSQVPEMYEEIQRGSASRPEDVCNAGFDWDDPDLDNGGKSRSQNPKDERERPKTSINATKDNAADSAMKVDANHGPTAEVSMTSDDLYYQASPAYDNGGCKNCPHCGHTFQIEAVDKPLPRSVS